MDFDEFLSKVVNVAKVPDSLEFKPAVLWLNAGRLPVGVVSLGGEKSSVIKLPSECMAVMGNIVPVLEVANKVFCENANLTDVILPNNIKTIRAYSFSGCTNLKRIFIPCTVREIKQYAFNSCDNLEDIYFSGTEEEWKQIRITHEQERLLNTEKSVLYREFESDFILGNEILRKAKVHYNCVLPEEEPRQLVATNKSLTYVYKKDIGAM